MVDDDGDDNDNNGTGINTEEDSTENRNAQDTQASGETQTTSVDLPAPKKRKKPSGYGRFLQSWTDEQKAAMERMEGTLRLNEEREERIMTTFLQESARSTERLVGQLFEGLRSLLPQPTHLAPQYSQFSAHQSYPYTINYPLDRPRSNESATHESDYRLYDLG